MRVAIYGAGAMGTVLGAYIAKAGKQVELISHNRKHVESLKKNGAKIVGEANFTVPVCALLPEEMHGLYDVIFLMTKQRENAQTVKFILPYLADDGVICTMQNGLPEPSVAQIAGNERCLGCAVSWGATFIGGGVSKLTSSPKKLTFTLGSIYGENPKLPTVKSILESMGEVTVTNNFLGARFAKLSVNAAFSSLSALTGLTFGQVSKTHKTAAVAQVLLKECFSVARANGIKTEKIQGRDIVKIYDYKNRVKKAISLALLPFAMKNHASITSGMYYDLIKGKNCEIDFINGVIINYGKKANCPTPVNERITELVHQIEKGQLKISVDNVNLISLP